MAITLLGVLRNLLIRSSKYPMNLKVTSYLAML